MYSKYNYSPSSASLRFSKSSSNEQFYRQATQRSQNYQSSMQSPKKDCLACRHEKQKSTKGQSSRFQTHDTLKIHPPHAEDYYPANNQQELKNLKKAKRFLEDLLQKSKKDFRVMLDKSEGRMMELVEEIQQKNRKINELQKQISANQLLQQYGVTSLVGTYVEKRDHTEEREQQNTKIRQLLKKIQKLQSENVVLKSAAQEQTKSELELQQLQQKIKQSQIYGREYDSMKLLIHKMEIEKEETAHQYQRTMNQLNRNHRNEVAQYMATIDRMKLQSNQQVMQIDIKDRQIQRTRVASQQISQTQFDHLQELIQQKNEQIDKLQSRLNCIESELTFLKNRYGYLLKLSKNGAQMNSITDLQEYCIERVERHNINNGKQSLIGLNLSPIKRR